MRGFGLLWAALTRRPTIVAGGDVVGRDKIEIAAGPTTAADRRRACGSEGLFTFRKDGSLMTAVDKHGQTHYAEDGSIASHLGDPLPGFLRHRTIARGRPEQVEDVGMMRAAGETRKGDWMETWTGTRFYPLDARPEEVFIEDIAHHLARINRYNGACRWEHYSVAEHSVKMALWVLVETNDPKLAFEALMHDACEAYIGDMVRPLKRHMPAFVDAEVDLWCGAIAPRYGLPKIMSPLIAECDNRILVDERAQVMAPSGNPWGIDHLEPLGVRLEGWGPDLAKEHFLQAFNFLWEMLET